MIGERIGNFNVVSQLGRGGMGEVYLAEHDKIGTRVAIKVLQPHISNNKDHVERFFNEAIAVSKIQHSGIGKIFDVGFHTDRAYLVMEFLAGETLATRIRRLGKLPLAHVCELGRQICGVLEAVHKAGITHRDLKPDNIFIVPDEELPGGERIKIVDFGIAKLSGAGPGLTATNSGSMGTPAYMSPEQWKNSKAVDWRADAYSLGCLTFEMIAGRPPFIAETIGEACSLHLTEPPPRLGALVAVPAALDALIANLLAKLPEQRPPSMREIANAFATLAATAPAQQLAAPAIAIGMGATMPSTPPMSPNQATQLTSAPASQQNNPTMPAPPPSMHHTTLGGATGSTQIAAATPPRKRRWIWGVAGLVAAVAIVAIIAIGGIYRSTNTQVVNVNTNTGSGSGSNVAAGSAGSAGSATPGSGSSVAAKPSTAQLEKEVRAVVARDAGSGSGRRRVRLPGRAGPSVGRGSAGGSGARVAFEAGDDSTALPKFTPDVLPIVRLLYPQFFQCGKDHDATGMLVDWTLKTNPDGTFSSVAFVARRNFARVSMSAALTKCLTTVFKSVTYGRSSKGGSIVNAVLLR